jgi:hypothetical protein
MPKPVKLATKLEVGFENDQVRLIDERRHKQADRPTRSAAVRLLVAQALAGSLRSGRTNPKSASKATVMAAREVNRLVDPSVPAGERAKRKRRLVKGPSEFRAIRKDQAKSKS